MKTMKSFTIEADIYDYMKTKGNMSAYISDLVMSDMRLEAQKKKGIDDITAIVQDTTIAQEQKDQRDADNIARRKAWSLLLFEVQEEIKKIPSWNEVWKNKLYPLLLEKGELTTSDVWGVDVDGTKQQQ